ETATRIGSLENQMQQVSAGDQAQDVEAEIQELAASLQGDLDEYVRLHTGAVVLRKAMERYRERNQGPILQGASRRFAELTCGSFTGLRAEYGDQDSPFLVGIRAGMGQTVPVTAMSTGTRDQLYLAVRLASLEHYLDQHPPIPFIVDDILVQFDDDRSAATLRVLAEVGRRTQVIFFTHHVHLVQLARQCVAPDELSVHELTPREPRTP
ncbi:MAG: ATP-binding protein, partial [Pirellulaceae bacterium]